MKRRWQKLKNDVRGAVTIFVTLLLIPAVLVTGSGVDIARIYVARSVLHDANQLAANSALTEYDALLHDVYGLFGVCVSDPELGEMVNEYVKTAIFAPDVKDSSDGSFKLFYGSDPTTTIKAAGGQNLGQAQIIRRQIEEYAKLRAPVIIAEKIIEVIDQFKKIKQDADAIKTKMELDEKVDDIDKLYKELYEQINDYNKLRNDVQTQFSTVNTAIEKVRTCLKEMAATRSDYTDLYNTTGTDENELNDLILKYEGQAANVRASVQGGWKKTGWQPGHYEAKDDEPEAKWIKGEWAYSKGEWLSGVTPALSNAKKKMEDFQKQEEKLVNQAQKIERKKAELRQKLEELRSKLNNSSEELQNGLNAKGKDGYSVLESYELLLEDNVTSMVNNYLNVDKPLREQAYNTLKNANYGDQTQSLNDVDRFNDLAHVTPETAGYSIYALENGQQLGPDDKLHDFANANNITLTPPSGIKTFQEIDATNQKFYELLNKMYADADDKDKKAKRQIKETISSFFDAVQELQKGISFNPEGALYYKAKDNGGGGKKDFSQEGDWSKEGEGQKQTKKALDNSIISKIGNLLGDAADKILLLTYDTEMFSCYTSKKADEDKKVEGDMTMSGIPLDTTMNYFFQSEQEYLFTGSNDAVVNLAAVAGMLLLVRFVFNYIASFTIDDVNTVVDSAKAALAWMGPLGVVIGELLRAAIAMAESALDVVRLRSGKKVALIKVGDAANDWKLSVKGLIDFAKDVAKDTAKNAVKDQAGTKGSADAGDTSSSYFTLTYADYLRIFLLFKDGDVLAKNTINLIQFNLTNYKNKINADEQKMSSTELVKLSTMATGIDVVTTVDLRMLYLSQPFAQEGVNGVVPPGNVQLVATDHRGY